MEIKGETYEKRETNAEHIAKSIGTTYLHNNETNTGKKENNMESIREINRGKIWNQIRKQIDEK